MVGDWALRLKNFDRSAMDAEPDDLRRLLADLATGLWRLRRRLLDPATGEPIEALRRPLRDVEALCERLREEQVGIQDHTGSLYDPTLSLRVAAFQPTPGANEERVVETLKPTVYWRQQRIQIGEVIVAMPEKNV
jgi:hypothetical protein